MEKRLGLGLENLFGKNQNSEENTIENVSLDLIQPASWQPRQYFDENSLNELALSIKEYGVIQPIILKKYDDHYEIVAGERRYRAAKIANLVFIPAIIVNFNDEKSLEVSMIENLQRKDLSPIEKAEGFDFLIKKLGMTQEDLSQKLGFSRSYITNFLRINKLSYEIKEKIITKDISMGHAKILVNKKNADELAQKIVEEKLSVRDLENLNKQKKNDSSSNEIIKFEEMISECLDTDVSININKNSGNIIIKFLNLEELERLITKLCF